MTYKPVIISVSETWITPLSSEPFFNIPNYKFVHNSRLHSKGGGIAFYVKDTIKFHVLTKLTTMHEKPFKSIFIKLELKMKVLSVKLSMGLLYMTLNQIKFVLTT